ncbi:MAG: PorT family protein [Bacteroidetes bacterium]|nr:MAG: PorT family protein [Bacteroidota bacterium]
MKKIAFILFIAFAFTAKTEVRSQNFRLGLKGSPSLAWFKSETDNYDSEGVRLGFSYGLISEFVLAEQYNFATGINITYFGGKLSYPVGDQNDPGVALPMVERTYRIQNLEVPLTLKMKTREIGYNTYFAKFGFGGSVNLTAKANDKFYNPANSNTDQVNDIDIKGDTPLFRVSMILGLGMEHSLGGTTALIGGLTFNNGFTNILKGKDDISGRNRQARANYLELSIGVIF